MKKTIMRFLKNILLFPCLMSIEGFGIDETILISDIPDMQEGKTATVGGVASAGINIKIVVKDAEGSIVYETETPRLPNNTFFASFVLPANKKGLFSFSANGVVKKFNVTENKGSLHTEIIAPKYVGVAENVQICGKQVYVDGEGYDFGGKASLKNGKFFVPVNEFAALLNMKIEKKDEEISLVKGINSFAVNDKMDIYSENDTTYICVEPVAKVFGYKYTSCGESCTISTKEKHEWWYKYPTQAEIELTGYEMAKSTHARTIRNNFIGDFTWGVVAQMTGGKAVEKIITQLHSEGLKAVSYFEATGQLLNYFIGYNNEKDKISGFPDENVWSVANEQNKQPATDLFNESNDRKKQLKYWTMTGLFADLNDEPSVKAIGYSRETLGYSEPTYPDGSSALGYIDDKMIPFPLNSKVYDSSTAKTVTDVIAVDYDMSNFYDYKKFGVTTPIDGITTVYSKSPYWKAQLNTIADETGAFASPLSFSISKDTSSPLWREQPVVSSKNTCEMGIDGVWFDNWSPWDNFQPLYNSFGEWTYVKFREFLKENFNLSELDIIDIEKFNIREYMRGKAVEYGCENPDMSLDIAYRDDRWFDDKIWNAFKVFKMREGRSLLQSFYKTFKDQAKKYNYSDGFMVSGNDMPIINFGWVEDDWLDVCAAEMGYSWNLGMGSKGQLDPPYGKMAIFYNAATEQQSGPYSILWMYAKENLRDKTNLGKVLESEAFANNAFIKYAYKHTIGTIESHKWLNEFIYKNEEAFGMRYKDGEICVLYSPQNQLLTTYPAFIMGEHNKQYHQQGVWGFSHALEDTHIPYRVLPEWKLNEQTVKSIGTLILPNLQAMNDSLLPLLTKFTENGGRLVITGSAGERYSADGFFMKRVNPLLNTLVGCDISGATGVKRSDSLNDSKEVFSKVVRKGLVVWMANPLGHTYFMASPEERAKMLSGVISFVGGSGKFDGSMLPYTVESNLKHSADNRIMFVDLVNMDINIDKDTINLAKNLKFRVKLPQNKHYISSMVISPEGNYEIAPIIRENWLEYTIDDLEIFVCVKIFIE